MAKLEIEGGQIVLCDVDDSVPVVKTIRGQDSEVFSQSEALQNLREVRHGRTGRGKDLQHASDVCGRRRHGNGWESHHLKAVKATAIIQTWDLPQ